MALKEIGALWAKENEKGRYLSGVLELEGKDGEKQRILIFANTKRGGKGPTHRMYLVDDSEDDQQKYKK